MAAPNPSGQNLPTSPTLTFSLQAAHGVAQTNHVQAAASRQSQHRGLRGGKAGPHPGVPGHSCVHGCLGDPPHRSGPAWWVPPPPSGAENKTEPDDADAHPLPAKQRWDGGKWETPLPSAFFVV